MFYRICQINNQVYPSWGYNLTIDSLKKMTIAYLESLFEQHSEENDLEGVSDVDSLTYKTKQIETFNAQELMEFIQGYLSQYDGEMEVEKSSSKFPSEECDSPNELVDGCYEGSDENWFITK